MTAGTLAPRDDMGVALPVLRLRLGGAHVVALGPSQSTVPLAPETRVVAVHATVDCWIATGDADVVATAASHHLPVGAYLHLSLGDDRRGGAHSHIAAIQSTETGTLFISEME